MNTTTTHRPNTPSPRLQTTRRHRVHRACRATVVGGQTSTFTWDTERQLASVTTPQGTESYVYGPDGQRLLKTTPTGRTLYLGDQEIKANLDGTNVVGTRTYSFGGQLIGTRTGSQAPKYLGVDQQGSVEASAAGQAAPDVTRAYDPYGKKRSGGTPDTQRGWLGQVEDNATSLNYLNARYYDPNLATFISPDPLYDLASPKSLNPFAYAWNNPTTYSDPSGKIPQECRSKVLSCRVTNSGGLKSKDNSRRDERGRTVTPPRVKREKNISGDRPPPEQVIFNIEELTCVENCGLFFEDVRQFVDDGCPGMGSGQSSVYDDGCNAEYAETYLISLLLGQRAKRESDIEALIGNTAINHTIDELSKSGQRIMDPKTGQTRAAHELDKHQGQGRFPIARGNQAAKNEQAQSVLDDILTDPTAAVSG